MKVYIFENILQLSILDNKASLRKIKIKLIEIYKIHHNIFGMFCTLGVIKCLKPNFL